jgi:phosphatidylethanolamine-binding protein (PEBP) family uncharacterized protein
VALALASVQAYAVEAFAVASPGPPVGDVPHHYVAQVYALDLPADALPAGLTRDALFAAIKDQVLAATSTVPRDGR